MVHSTSIIDTLKRNDYKDRIISGVEYKKYNLHRLLNKQRTSTQPIPLINSTINLRNLATHRSITSSPHVHTPPYMHDIFTYHHHQIYQTPSIPSPIFSSPPFFSLSLPSTSIKTLSPSSNNNKTKKNCAHVRPFERHTYIIARYTRAHRSLNLIRSSLPTRARVHFPKLQQGPPNNNYLPPVPLRANNTVRVEIAYYPHTHTRMRTRVLCVRERRRVYIFIRSALYIRRGKG